MKEKLYVISGLGADFSVLEKIEFSSHLEVIFLPWLHPTPNETLESYVSRMAEKIDTNTIFHLLGYSFGGIIAQEIAKQKKPHTIVILGSIRSEKEKSILMKIAKISKITSLLPLSFFSGLGYFLLRKIFVLKNPYLLNYFTVKDPYYLRWSIQKIVQWKAENIPQCIQVLGDKDIVFPIKKSNPDYIVLGGTHLFPLIKYKIVSKILKNIFEK